MKIIKCQPAEKNRLKHKPKCKCTSCLSELHQRAQIIAFKYLECLGRQHLESCLMSFNSCSTSVTHTNSSPTPIVRHAQSMSKFEWEISSVGNAPDWHTDDTGPFPSCGKEFPPPHTHTILSVQALSPMSVHVCLQLHASAVHSIKIL